MIQNMILWTALVPLILGVCLGLASRHSGAGRMVAGALLLAAALVVVIFVEGSPVFPPVAGKQKLPFALAALSVVFLLLGFRRSPASRLGFAGRVLALAGLPAFWIGYRILAAAPAKALVVLAILIFFAFIGSAWRTTEGSPRTGAGSPVIALLFVMSANAVVSVTGGYIGMAQISGSLAALTGGWLLVAYAAYLRGEDSALTPDAPLLLAWLVLSALALIVTMLFAPSVNLMALGLAALPLAVSAWISTEGGRFVGLPRALRPVIGGLLAALPALAAILVAALV